MNLERYEVEFSESMFEFEFVSTGKKGEIRKVVQFNPVGFPGIFNIGFGDRDLKTGKLSDSVVSDSGDGRKVLMTVADTILRFTKRHPSCQIVAIGSSRSRTRLYQMGISNNYQEISMFLEIYGRCNGKWEVFERGKIYDAFMVWKKE